MRHDDDEFGIEHLSHTLSSEDSHDVMLSKLFREEQRQKERAARSRRAGAKRPPEDHGGQASFDADEPFFSKLDDEALSRREEGDELDLSSLDELIAREERGRKKAKGTGAGGADEHARHEKAGAADEECETTEGQSSDTVADNEEASLGASGSRLSPDEVAELRFLDFNGKKRLLAKDTPDALLKILQEYAAAFSSEGDGSPDAYTGPARAMFVAAHILLNEQIARGETVVPAPAFRERIKMRPPYTGRAADLSNDRQVIDLHYFWAKGHRHCDERHTSAGLTGDAFDFDQALRFCRTVGRTTNKLNALELDDPRVGTPERLGAAVLRTDADRKLQEQINNSRSLFASKLRRHKLPPATRLDLWADILAAEKALDSLGRTVTGRTLNSFLQLIGTRDLPREDTLMSKLNSAKLKLGR